MPEPAFAPTTDDLLRKRVTDLRTLEGEMQIVKENYRKWLQAQRQPLLFQEEMSALKLRQKQINQSIDECIESPNQFEIPTVVQAIND